MKDMSAAVVRGSNGVLHTRRSHVWSCLERLEAGISAEVYLIAQSYMPEMQRRTYDVVDICNRGVPYT
jgi:hypothetical protein